MIIGLNHDINKIRFFDKIVIMPNPGVQYG